MVRKGDVSVKDSRSSRSLSRISIRPAADTGGSRASRSRTGVLVLESREADRCADVSARNKIVFRLLAERAICHLEHTTEGEHRSITARVLTATIGRSIRIVLVYSYEGLQVSANLLNELGESVVQVAGLLIRERFSAPIMGGGDEHLLDDE
jgi:hypothetical protein